MTPPTLVRLLTRHERDNRDPEELLRLRDAEVEALRREIRRLRAGDESGGVT